MLQTQRILVRKESRLQVCNKPTTTQYEMRVKRHVIGAHLSNIPDIVDREYENELNEDVVDEGINTERHGW